jgi:hypothetical protein
MRPMPHVDGIQMEKRLERTRSDKKECIVKSIGERHSPPARKEVLTKTYPIPQTIVPVEIRNTVTFK